jgi:hypothetical protein
MLAHCDHGGAQCTVLSTRGHQHTSYCPMRTSSSDATTYANAPPGRPAQYLPPHHPQAAARSLRRSTTPGACSCACVCASRSSQCHEGAMRALAQSTWARPLIGRAGRVRTRTVCGLLVWLLTHQCESDACMRKLLGRSPCPSNDDVPYEHQ